MSGEEQLPSPEKQLGDTGFASIPPAALAKSVAAN